MNVFLIAATSIDGFIGRGPGHFPDWTSPEDTEFFVQKTKAAGVLVMGATTYQTLIDKGRKLPGRRVIVYTNNPTKFDGAVETTSKTPKALCQQLEAEGVTDLAVCGGSTIYGLFVASGMVNELFITVEPLVFGAGLPLFDRELDVRYDLQEITQLNQHTRLMHYVASHS
ncbi:MAG: dihydrofolate reductase family protein [Candidatus Saccharibacteria bacterium]|nr:dihydrofolate reductase family protein [Candidatus Saccharibacteria bacterium]